MCDDHVPATPPPKRSRRRRVADLSGLAQAWESDVRKGSRKRKCLLQWKDPTKVGLTGFSSLKENWKVILHLINIYCPDSPPSKTVPVDDVKPEVQKFYEEIEVAPKSGLVHCESHSLKMFLTFMNRRHDDSTRKDNRLRALFDELTKYWPPKPRSKKNLVQDEEEGEDDEEADVEEDEEETETMTEPDEDDDRLQPVDPCLAEDLGVNSPEPASAYVGTIASDMNAENGLPEPFNLSAPHNEPSSSSNPEVDLLRQLAEIEQQFSVVEQSKCGLEQKIEFAKTEHDAQRLACRRVQQQQRACHSEMGSLETERQLLMSQVSEAEQKKKTLEQRVGREQGAQAALQGRRAALHREIKRLEQQDASALEASKQLNAEVTKLEEAKKTLHRRLQAASSEMAAKRHNLLSECQQLSPLSAGSERVFSFTPSSRDDALPTGSMEASRGTLCEGAADANTESRSSVSDARKGDSQQERTEPLKDSEERGAGGGGSRCGSGVSGVSGGFLSDCGLPEEAAEHLEHLELGQSLDLPELGLEAAPPLGPEDLLGAGVAGAMEAF